MLDAHPQSRLACGDSQSGDDRAAEKIRKAWREAIQPRPKIRCSDWVEKHVIIGDHEGSPNPGPFRYRRTPFGRTIADCCSDPQVRRITSVMGSQLIKTRTTLNAIAFWIDVDPGPVLYISGTEKAAEDLSLNRLRPMFEKDCKPLARRRFTDKTHWKEDEYWFDRCIVRLAGGRSVMQVASHAIRYLILDEVDKFRGKTGQHAGILPLAERRVKAYKGIEKILACSTPTTKHGEIWKLFLAGSQERYYVPCPHCRKEQVLRFEQVRWNKLVLNPELAGKTAWYECEHCHGAIKDQHKPDMIDRGRWVARFPDRVEHRSFHLCSLYSPFLTFGYFVEKFLQCHPLDEDGCVVEKSRPMADRHQAFINEDLGEIYEEPGEAQTEDTIREHQGLGTPWEYSPGVCPIETPIETIMYADVQHDCCYYVVRAYGAIETSFLLEYGTVQTIEALNEVARTQYRTAAGDPLIVRKVAIDSSDGTKVKEVYDACRRHGWIACKNRSDSQSPNPISVSKKPPPGIRKFLHITTPIFKNWLARKLKVTLGSPGAFHLHNRVGADYVRHMTCEKLVEEDGELFWRQTHLDNHLYDCEVGQLAIASHYRVEYRKGRLGPSSATTGVPAKEKRQSSSPGRWGGPQPGRSGPGGWR